MKLAILAMGITSTLYLLFEAALPSDNDLIIVLFLCFIFVAFMEFFDAVERPGDETW